MPKDKNYDTTPLRFKIPTEKHPNGSDDKFMHGVYFPATDLVINDMGGRGTGIPRFVGMEWIDDATKLPWYEPPVEPEKKKK